MKIGIGNDHVAVEYKKEIKKYIEEKYGYEVVNYGTDSTERFNYPVSGEAVANAVVSGEVDKGIVICGTGVGISLAANKVNGIRCVTCSEPYSALLSRQHNNTNMLAFGARVVGIELAKMIVDAWLSGEYEGGRHQVRIDMLKEIEEKGVDIARVTLHVGLGTFRPVKVDDVEKHHMHSEFYMITEESAQKINHAKEAGHRVICVGTTSCRTIESAADENGRLKECSGWTEIFIYPGYQFKILDALITNFHLPESTLIMLVSALAGKEHVMAAYEEAVKERYRFFSFGDAMFIR